VILISGREREREVYEKTGWLIANFNALLLKHK